MLSLNLHLIFYRKVTLRCDFSCTSQNNSLPLHREPTLGMSAHQRRRVADILKRRLLALCSDESKCRKFRKKKQNLATIDALRDVKYSSCAYLVRLLRVYVCAHAYLNYDIAREYFIFGVGFALSVLFFRQCDSLDSWNWQMQVSRFYYTLL